MITDWVEEDNLKAYLKRYGFLVHPKIRSGTASCWIFYSKEADMYSATVKFREQRSGRNIIQISPKREKTEIIVDAVCTIALHYA